MANKRQELEAALGAAVRDFQRATDEVDEVVTRLMGINRTDARCLDVLDERGRMTAGELAAADRPDVGRDHRRARPARAGGLRPSATRDDADRRRVLVEPTETARAAAAEYYGPLAELSAPVLAQISDAELASFVRFLRAANAITAGHAAALREREQRTPPR